MISLSLVSCTTQKELQKQKDDKERAIYDSWLQHPKSELIRSWGAPTRTVTDGQGGEILIYETSRKIANVIYGTYMERTITNYKEMFVNSSGIIYHWRSGSR